MNLLRTARVGVFYASRNIQQENIGPIVSSSTMCYLPNMISECHFVLP